MQDCSTVFPTRQARPFIQLAGPLSETFQGGYTPQQIRSAYGFSEEMNGAGQTIALIETGNQPNIRADLEVFNRFFSLPATSLTIRRIGPVPTASDPNWALEATLDAQWAHVLAPGAELLLIYAASAGIGDLMQAVDLAGELGADVVSMSWGRTEFANQTTQEQIFRRYPQVSFVAASGDESAIPLYPSVSPQVLSAGGTSLVLSEGGARISEIAWYGGGGGPSLFFPIPPAQERMEGVREKSAGMRGTPDVSFCADPDYGVVVYQSMPMSGSSGWGKAGGTSLAAPAWAAILAGARQYSGTVSPADLYRLAGGRQYLEPQPYFIDITEGASRLYQAQRGWDLCTGLGSPRIGRLQAGLAQQE
ncbi:MAG: S53 family peptidase [Oscillospiraceae bacterium]|nr:S53 family peptidase [Oscillospiraceae bacterium]